MQTMCLMAGALARVLPRFMSLPRSLSLPIPLSLSRSLTTCIVAALLSVLAVSIVRAQSYPTRPVRLVVPYPAGSGTDIVARALAQKLSMVPGYSVVVDNRPGGGTIIGMEIVARANPDGHTLLVATTSLAITPGLTDKLPFDPIRDFAPINYMDSAPLLMVVTPGINVSNLKEFLALVRAKPGELNYASSGNGGAIHLSMELLKSMTGIRITHVPYKGSPAALLDVLAGRVPVMFNIISSSTPHLASGRLRALGVTGATRTAALPNVPTIAEAGVPGYEAVSWHGLLAPAGTPSAVVNMLYEHSRRIMTEPDVKQTLEAQGFDIRNEPPDRFAAFVKSEVAKWTKVVKESGAKAD